MTEKWDQGFSNPEIVTLAIYILGGAKQNIDTEDIAMKSYELAPTRFAWTKYKDQVNLVNVRISLSDAKKPKKYGYLCGSLTEGWSLSKKGVKNSDH
jgi:hypothetical protein